MPEDFLHHFALVNHRNHPHGVACLVALGGVSMSAMSVGSLAAMEPALRDPRDVDRSWYAMIDDSHPGLPHGEQPLVVIADDGTWVCAWTAGKFEGAPDQHITSKRSKDHGKTWSDFIDIESSQRAKRFRPTPISTKFRAAGFIASTVTT